MPSGKRSHGAVFRRVRKQCYDAQREILLAESSGLARNADVTSQPNITSQNDTPAFHRSDIPSPRKTSKSKRCWSAAEDDMLLAGLNQGLVCRKIVKMCSMNRSESAARNRRLLLSRRDSSVETSSMLVLQHSTLGEDSGRSNETKTYAPLAMSLATTDSSAILARAAAPSTLYGDAAEVMGDGHECELLSSVFDARPSCVRDRGTNPANLTTHDSVITDAVALVAELETLVAVPASTDLSQADEDCHSSTARPTTTRMYRGRSVRAQPNSRPISRRTLRNDEPGSPWALHRVDDKRPGLQLSQELHTHLLDLNNRGYQCTSFSSIDPVDDSVDDTIIGPRSESSSRSNELEQDLRNVKHDVQPPIRSSDQVSTSMTLREDVSYLLDRDETVCRYECSQQQNNHAVRCSATPQSALPIPKYSAYKSEGPQIPAERIGPLVEKASPVLAMQLQSNHHTGRGKCGKAHRNANASKYSDNLRGVAISRGSIADLSRIESSFAASSAPQFLPLPLQDNARTIRTVSTDVRGEVAGFTTEKMAVYMTGLMPLEFRSESTAMPENAMIHSMSVRSHGWAEKQSRSCHDSSQAENAALPAMRIVSTAPQQNLTRNDGIMNGLPSNFVIGQATSGYSSKQTSQNERLRRLLQLDDQSDNDRDSSDDEFT